MTSPAATDPRCEHHIVGRSHAADELRHAVNRLGPTDLTVLLTGETGVGKEVVAESLHRASGRTGRFVPVNIAAIPTDLLEAELFGSVRGAYTGADRARTGLVESARSGTLFLDEVGDLAASLQVKLLRFMESREVRAVGSTVFERIDVRVVSATHRDLHAGTVKGWFRPDLYYRLASATITVPPLRKRKPDIAVFRRLFLREVVDRLGIPECRWHREADRALEAYHWPGNIRELRHVVEVAAITADGGPVSAESLALAGDDPGGPSRWDEAMVDFRKRFLSAALRRNNGNRTATARELGISRQTVLYHVRNLGLSTTHPPNPR
jgi:DNA-binding NtrC family response regulator